jgi:meiotic recombination protein SPO11
MVLSCFVLFVEIELDRIVLKDKVSKRAFVNTSQCRKTTIMTKVVQLIYEVLGKKIHITKRDLFYTDVKLFKNQSESDSVFDDVACMVGCTRSCLNVVASAKGLVVGRVSFRDDGDLINCMAMGVGGKAIPPFMDKISDIQSTAKVGVRLWYSNGRVIFELPPALF